MSGMVVREHATTREDPMCGPEGRQSWSYEGGPSARVPGWLAHAEHGVTTEASVRVAFGNTALAREVARKLAAWALAGRLADLPLPPAE